MGEKVSPTGRQFCMLMPEELRKRLKLVKERESTRQGAPVSEASVVRRLLNTHPEMQAEASA